MIKNVWTGQVEFGSVENCNHFMNCMENNPSFKLFKHEAM